MALERWQVEALDRVGEATARPVAWTASALYAGLAVAHLLLLDGQLRTTLAATAAGTSALLLVATLGFQSGHLQARPLLTLTLALAAVNSVLHLMLTGESWQTTNLILVLLAAGVFALGSWQQGLLQALIWVGWLWAVRDATAAAKMHFGLAMLMASILAVVTFRMRRKTTFADARQRHELLEGRTALARSLATVARQEAESRLMMDAMSDAVVRLDARGRTRSTNRMAAELLGRPDKADGGGSLVDLALPEHRERVLDLLASRQEGAKVEVHMKTSLGPLWLELAAARLPDGGHVVLLRDVEARRRLEALKDSVIATTGHELRTPLTAIHGALALMEGADEATRSALLETARASSERLVRLVDRSLDLERLAQADDSPRSPTSTHQILQTAVDILQAHPKRQGKELVVLGPDVPLVADPDALVQVVTNLAGNALRYAPPGSRIDVGCKAAADHVMFYVRDQGPGVPVEAREAIFEAFAQAEGDGERHEGTTGLGLTISQAIVERHGGRLWLADTEVGAEFRFAIPVQEEPA